jgi:hypothetical protein
MRSATSLLAAWLLVAVIVCGCSSAGSRAPAGYKADTTPGDDGRNLIGVEP